jgi:hypothetical protein
VSAWIVVHDGRVLRYGSEIEANKAAGQIVTEATAKTGEPAIAIVGREASVFRAERKVVVSSAASIAPQATQ